MTFCLSHVRELLARWERSPEPPGPLSACQEEAQVGEIVPLVESPIWGAQTCVKFGTALMTISALSVGQVMNLTTSVCTETGDRADADLARRKSRWRRGREGTQS